MAVGSEFFWFKAVQTVSDKDECAPPLRFFQSHLDTGSHLKKISELRCWSVIQDLVPIKLSATIVSRKARREAFLLTMDWQFKLMIFFGDHRSVIY